MQKMNSLMIKIETKKNFIKFNFQQCKKILLHCSRKCKKKLKEPFLKKQFFWVSINKCVKHFIKIVAGCEKLMMSLSCMQNFEQE